MSILRTNGTPLGTSPDGGRGLPEDGSGRTSGSRENISFSDLLASLWRHAFLIAVVAAFGGAIAAWSVFREVPSYRSSAVLRLTDARRSMARGMEDGTTDRSQTTNPTLSQIQILRSRALIGSVVDSEGLRLGVLERGFSPTLLSQVRTDPGVVADTFFLTFSTESVTVRDKGRETRVRYSAPYQTAGLSFAIKSKPQKLQRATLVLWPREWVIDWLIAELRVSPREETDVVDVSYANPVPEVAQRVVNRLVRTFQDADVRQSQGQSRRRRVFLEAQLREVNNQLASSEAALASFRRREQAFSSRDKIQAQQTALTAVEIRQRELDADRRMYESLLARLESPAGDRKSDELRAMVTAPEVNANPVIAQLYQQLAMYQTRRDSLTTGQWRSATTNPDVARLDQLIASSEQRLLGAVRGYIATVDARREAMDTLRANTAAAIQALPLTESAEERLSRQVASNRTLADHLVDEYRKARMAEEVEAGQVEMVDWASLPYRPVPRLRTLRLLIGVLIGLGLGMVAAVVIDSTNASVRRRLDLEEDMRIPVLSVIPRITQNATLSGRSPSRLSSILGRRRRNGGGQARRADSASGGQSLGNFMSPSGGEAFRLLRSSLKWTQRNGTGNTLAVSSALSEEGKTTTSANLAVVCALEGKRVLLIDCDLRRPRLHQVFRVPRDPGLAHVLRADLAPSIAVRDTFVTGLSLLPAGRYSDRFADFFGSDRMRDLLKGLSEQFDMIILDTPPVLAVADAVAVAPLVDGVLFVVGAGTTDRRAVEQAINQLRSAGARVIGAVLNDSRGEVERYDDHDYYDYQDEYARSTSTT